MAYNIPMENLSDTDIEMLIWMSLRMEEIHGHSDFEGLSIDRKRGIHLENLMDENCSHCGIPRRNKSNQLSPKS